MEIHAIQLSFITEHALFDQLLVYVPPNKRAKINKFHQFEDKLRSLIADLLSRVVMCRLMYITNRNFTSKLNVTSYGKPYLEGSSLHYNLSHSGVWVVLVVDHEPVGIDIEKKQTIDLDIASGFFSPAEYADLSSLPCSQRTNYFYSLWTLKEALIKADGRGLSIQFDTFSFSLRNDRIYFDPACSDLPQYYFHQYDIAPDYSLSVCAMNDKFPENIHIWDFETLISNVKNFLR